MFLFNNTYILFSHSLPDLNKDIAALRKDLLLLETELKFHSEQQQTSNDNDAFVAVIGDFLNVAQYGFDELTSEHEAMKEKVIYFFWIY